MPAQLLHHFNPSEKFSPSFLHLFTTLDCPTITSLYPLLNKLPSHSYTILPSWQPNSYIIVKPLNKLPPRSYTILTTLASQLLNHFTPSGRITPSLLHNLLPVAAQLLHNFTTSEQITPSLLHHFNYLSIPTLKSF